MVSNKKPSQKISWYYRKFSRESWYSYSFNVLTYTSIAIHDYEDFESLSIGENEDIEYISKLAQILDNADDTEAMAAWLDYAKDLTNNPDIEALAEEFSEYYCGHWDSERDFALKSDEVEAGYNWSEFEEKFQFWSFHIDWDSVARDLFIDGYDSVKASPHGIYVFREYRG